MRHLITVLFCTFVLCFIPKNTLADPPVVAGEFRQPMPLPQYESASNAELMHAFSAAIVGHPDIAQMRRLVLAMKERRFFLSITSGEYQRRLKGERIGQLAHVSRDDSGHIPVLKIDSIIFDVRYYKKEIRDRILEHEIFHLLRVLDGKVLLSTISKKVGESFTRADARKAFEEEVLAFKQECSIAVGPEYYDPNSKQDFCLVLKRNGEKALRVIIADVYTRGNVLYEKYSAYIRDVAVNPSLP